MWKARIDFCKLSSDLYMYVIMRAHTLALMCPHIYMHTTNKQTNKVIQINLKTREGGSSR